MWTVFVSWAWASQAIQFRWKKLHDACLWYFSANCCYRWNTRGSKSKKSIDWVHCSHSLSFWEIIFCLDMSAFLHLVSFCQPNHFFSNLSRREMGLSMTAIKIVPRKSNNYFHTCLISEGILECFWMIPDIWSNGSSCQNLNPHLRQVKWQKTRFRRMSPYFRQQNIPPNQAATGWGICSDFRSAIFFSLTLL